MTTSNPTRESGITPAELHSTVEIVLTRAERALIRECLDFHLGSRHGEVSLTVLQELRPMLEWCLPLLDNLAWTDTEDSPLAARPVRVRCEELRDFIGDKHREYLSELEGDLWRLEKVRRGEPGWLYDGKTIEQSVAIDEGLIRTRRTEIALLESILVQLTPGGGR